MNPDQRLDALLAAARDSAPDTTRAEYAFETRLLARLREERGSSWFGIALKLSPIFAALVIAAGAWFTAATSLESDAAEYAWDAVSGGGGASALTAWLPEADR